MKTFKSKFLAVSLMAGLLGDVSTAAHAQDFLPESVSLVTPVHTADKTIDFVVRGNIVDQEAEITSPLQSDGLIARTLDAIQQGDPIDWSNDVVERGVKKIKIVDVKLNGLSKDYDRQLFSNFNSEDEADEYFKVKRKLFEDQQENGQPITSDALGLSPVKKTSNGSIEHKNITYKGHDLQISRQLVYVGTNHVHAPMAQDVIDTMHYISEHAPADEMVIFYVHCDQGADRTGALSALYLFDTYLQLNKANIKAAQQAAENGNPNQLNAIESYLKNHLMSEGFIYWSSPDDYTKGKHKKTSDRYKYLLDDNGDAGLLPGTLNRIITLDWAKVVPPYDDLVPPAINDYAFNLPLCKDGYGLDKCLTFVNGDHHKISWDKSSVNLTSDLSHYKFQVAYINEKGLPIDLETVAPAYNGDVGSFTLKTLNLNAAYESIKLYVTKTDGSSISDSNKTKYQFVASMKTPSTF